MVLAAVQQNGSALRHASEPLRADREVVLAAVQQNGQALRHASEPLRADREVVLAAVRVCARDRMSGVGGYTTRLHGVARAGVPSLNWDNVPPERYGQRRFLKLWFLRGRNLLHALIHAQRAHNTQAVGNYMHAGSGW